VCAFRSVLFTASSLRAARGCCTTPHAQASACLSSSASTIAARSASGARKAVSAVATRCCTVLLHAGRWAAAKPWLSRAILQLHTASRCATPPCPLLEGVNGLSQLLPQPEFFGYCDQCLSIATNCHALRPTHEKCSVIATIVRRICWPAAP
jgi:hypothetical protein